MVEEVNNSLWGQMDTNIGYLKDTVTKVQGYEDPVEEEPKVELPKKKLTPEEEEKESQEKMKLFSEFVAADAEASEPIIQKAPKKDAPLHFKYYSNDGEEDSLTESASDEILGSASAMLNKGKREMKYESEDTVEAKPVDYSKSINMQTLLEPISTSETVPSTKEQEVIELAVS